MSAPTARTSSPARDRSAEMVRWLRRGWIALGVIGLVARLLPILYPHERLFWQFPTEDGYLTLTIARNIGIGNGMSVADGTIPTNGTQPLAALLWSALFALCGGHRAFGVGGVLVCEAALSVVAAMLLARLGDRLFGDGALERVLVRVVAAAWFASPVVVPHSMNCLETGFYGLAAIWVASLFTETDDEVRRPWNALSVVKAGIVLGFAFWARNDAAFLILAACLTYLLCGPDRSRATLLERLPRVLGFGSIAVLVALPWIANNYLRFGHIMPISGISESMDAHFAKNLHQVPAVLVEYIGVMVPIPWAIQNTPAVIAACAVVSLLFIAFLAVVYRRASSIERRLFTLSAIFLLCLSAFYGLFFGAGYFMARYLFPASPFLALLWAAVVVHAFSWANARLLRGTMAGAAAAVLFMILAVHTRAYTQGVPHQHFQVVNWVNANVGKDEWIGAIQTGTLGYFHDRTINLDGKVNPEALEARIQDRVPTYAVERGLRFLADWSGDDSIARWIDRHAVIAEHFTVEVDTREPSLVVLRRKD